MPDIPAETLSITTSDGLSLGAEMRVPDEPWAAAVLAHPHPMHGGNMRSIVPGALFDALPDSGVAALRFNFRGIGESEGEFGDGVHERLDIVAAIDTLHSIVEGIPLIVAGWSFGADTSLAVTDNRLAGWLCVAPPLRDEKLADMAAASDPRPKLFVIPQNDQFRQPQAVNEITHNWTNARVEIIPGADHFLIGRIERVAPLCEAFLAELAGR